MLLLNFKPFEARYYLFLVPLIGAGVGEVSWRILHLEWSAVARRGLVSLLAVMFAVAGGLAIAKARHITQANVAELTQVVPIARHVMKDNASIVSRKPNLSFYTNAEWVFMPDLQSLQDMGEFLQIQETSRSLYILYGQVEQSYRPQFAALLMPDQAPAWLDLVAESDPPGQWALYRYQATQDGERVAP